MAVLRLTRREIAALEAQRQEDATNAVVRVQAAEDTAVQVVAAGLNSTELVAVTVVTDLGPVHVNAVPVPGLEAVGGTRTIHEVNASVEVTTATVQEIEVLLGEGEGALLLSVAVLDDNSTGSLETDAIAGEASTLVSVPLSISFWKNDGTRIEVKDLQNPLQFTLEVTNPDAKCGFWDEDMGKWSTDGVTTISWSNGILQCSTMHLSIFGAILNVVLSNIALALSCSTLSSLLSGTGFANLLKDGWLLSGPSILNMVFHGLGMVCVLLAWRYDRQQEIAVPWEERDLILMRVREDDKKEDLTFVGGLDLY